MAKNLKKMLGYVDEKKSIDSKSGLDLLKEHFGHSTSTIETETDNRERMHEILTGRFNPSNKNKSDIIEKILLDNKNKYPASFLKKKNNFLFHCN